MSKPIWVFVAGSYRTGSTTHFQMARDVVEVTKSGIAIGYHNERRLRDFDALDFGNLEAVREVYAKHKIECPFAEPPRFSRKAPYIVCKVFEFLPDGFRGESSHGKLLHRQKRIRAVVSVRDPRDIATSMRRREEQRSDDGRKENAPFDFEDLVTQKFPIWLAAMEKWIDLGPEVTLVSRFEDFTRDLEGEVRRIAVHLGVDLGPDVTPVNKFEPQNLEEVQRIAGRLGVKVEVSKPEEITQNLEGAAQRIAADYQIDAIRKRKDDFWKKRRKDPDVNEDAALPSIPALLFASSGQWRRELDEEEAGLVYKANKQFFERFGYAE